MSEVTSQEPEGNSKGGFANILAGSQPFGDNIKKMLLQGDTAMAFGVIAILFVLLFPMPAMALDALFAVSIIFSVLILMTALFIQTPLEFSAFPTVLLVATMMRLALNLASTRLILSNGHNGGDAAGNVIEAFGNLIMRGNFVIGIIIFAILIIVNFIVITKGSGRIAEVAARFTLDAMPGKQMAIDADLSAGLIDEAEAKTRRKKLEDESSFFGSMDGASKFVRGDAIAGLLITFINVIGGIIIGVAQMDMSMGDAAQAYTLLTVGDGLVSQIPALIVSTAAGLLVSKAGVRESTDKVLGRQFTNYPKALGMSGIVMVLLSLLPGIPMLPFVTLGAVAGAGAWFAHKKQQEELIAGEISSQQAAVNESEEQAEEPISQTLQIDDLRIEIGYSLLPLINAEVEEDRLTQQIKALRRQFAADYGFVIPSVRLLDNLQLGPHDYTIKIKEVESGSGAVFPNEYMVMDPAGTEADIPGTRGVEPTFGLPCVWVNAANREEATLRGLTVVDSATVLITHLTELLKANMPDLLSYANVQNLLNDLPKNQQKLLEDIVPSQVTITGIQRVLQSLLAEQVSIRDLQTILEGIAEATATTGNMNMVTEHVRSRLARQICAGNTGPNGYLPVITLSPKWETNFLESQSGDGEEKILTMAPSMLQDFVTLVRDVFENAAMTGEIPVLLTSPQVRRHVRGIVERFRPQTVVLSQNEIHPRAKLKTLDRI